MTHSTRFLVSILLASMLFALPAQAATNSCMEFPTGLPINCIDTIPSGTGIDNVVEDLTPQLGGDLDMNSKNIDFPTTANISDVLDQDDMAGNSATKLATQQSIKAYVDGKTGANETDPTVDSSAEIQAIIGADVYQAYDADLTTYAGITPAVNVQSLLGAADYAAMRGLLDLESGTDFNAYDADLTTWAGITPSANVQTLLGSADYAAFKGYLSIDDLVTLSGVADGAVNLGTFTGTTINDNVTIKAALQALESAVELAGGGTPTAITVADTTDTTSFIGLWESATGDLGPKTDAGATYNATTGIATFTGITSNIHSSAVADPADAGIVRLGNAETVCWEASPAGTDVCMTVNSTEQFTISGSLLPTSDDAIDLGSATVQWRDAYIDGTLEADAITENGNAVYNSSETPGGELGGTWASPTIDDSITVTGWGMGASTATTPAADDNDTSLATTAYVQTELNAAGGRSVTCGSGSCDADAELYTEEVNAWIETPAVESMNDFVVGFMNAVTITYVKCKTDAGTVDLNLEDGSDNNILSAELVCDTGGQTSCASGCDVNTINGSYDNITAKTEDIDLDISAVATATRVSLMIGYTIDD